MKIEFRKIPLHPSDFELYDDSVKFSGTFCKISPKLAKIEGTIEGPCEVDCYKCGKTFTQELNDKVNFLVSDGVYSKKSEEEELVVIETSDHILDFGELLHSEIESFRSEYLSCDTCTDDTYIDIEY
jgi:hypothetical protein